MAGPDDVYNTLMSACDDIARLMSQPAKAPIPFSRVADKEGIDHAVICACEMQRAGTYHGERIGVVNPDLPKILCIGSLIRGQVVLFSPQGAGKVIVEVPYTPEHIERQKLEGSLVYTHTLVNVPREYILELVSDKTYAGRNLP